MAEGVDTKKMPLPKTCPDIEWSTREKLALASYVMRSGEQHWSGAGRMLRPLGEPGRPSEWFSPKFCAQQYTALMEQADAPKRKRSDSTENVQPGVPPEEAIISRLTKERIEELKKHVRNERMEYRKLKREVEMIESGELDDSMDELIRNLNFVDDTDIESQPVEKSLPCTSSAIPVSDSETMKTLTAKDTTVMEIEKSCSENDENVEVKQQENDENSDNGITHAETDQSELTEHARDSLEEPFDTQPVTQVTTSMEDASAQHDKSLESTLTPASPKTENVAENSGLIFPESALVKAEEVMMEMKTLPLDNSSVPKGNDDTDDHSNNDQTLPVPESMETQVVEAVDRTDEGPGYKELKAELEPILPSPIAVESVSTKIENAETVLVEEEIKISPSQPGTPCHTSSFVYDSTFPYSPALSHSSDMDPESTAAAKAWRKSIMILWKQVASHRYASIFLQPVTDEIAPNYSNTVYRSTDLATIKKNIESGVIRSTSEFRRDIMLMFQNALMYNSAEHDVYKWTLEMQKDFIDQIAQFIATQMMVETAQPSENKSLRRSTMRRSVLSEKSGQNTRSRRSATSEVESKSNH